MDLAGVTREEIDVEVRQEVLVIRGQRESPCPQSSSKVHLMEIDHGRFRRTITIPSSVEVDNIKARYVDGYLWVELPKSSG
jgi:HSP20 family protein